MPRPKRVKELNPEFDDSTLPIIGGKKRHAVGHLVDPTEALPGSIKQASSDTQIVPKTPRSAAEARLMWRQLINLMADPECNGEMALALARVCHVNEEYARLHEAELHDKLRHACKGLSVTEVMQIVGADAPARVVRLGKLMHQNVDARLSIVAARELGTYDDSKEEAGRETLEDWIRSTLGGG